MIHIKRTFFWFLAMLLCHFLAGQQSQMYTQFGYNKLSFNPAYAGNDEYHSITGMYRDQWNGIPGAPDAQMLTVDLARFRDRVGVGFTVERQSIGIDRNVFLSSSYAYKVKTQSGTLSGGLSVSFKNLVRDFTDQRLVGLQDISQDGAIEVSRLSKSLLNFGAGIYFNNEKIFAGISVPGLINNDLELGDEQDDIKSVEVRHMFLMGGGLLPIHENLDFKPQFLLRLAENAPMSFDLNLGLVYDDRYHSALTYRSGGAQGDIGESLDLMLGFQISDKILLGFAYDFTISELRKYENGSVELLFNYRFIKSETRDIKMANPRFF